MTAATAPKERSLDLRLTLSLGMLSALAPLATDMQIPGLPDLATSLHTSNSLAAATVSVFFVGFAVGQIVVGGLSDRYGRRRPILICSALFAVTGALCATAPNIQVLLAMRVLQGLAGAGTVVSVRAAVRDYAQGSAAARLYSQLSTVSMTAPIIAPLLGGAVLRFTSWRGLFWVFTVLSVALFVLALFMVEESLPKERRREGGGHLRLLVGVVRHPGFAHHLVLSTCQGVILLSYLSMGALFLRHDYGVGPQTYSYLFAINGAGMVAGQAINARLVTRLGSLTMLTLSIVGYSVGTSMLVCTVLLHAPLAVAAVSQFVILSTLTISVPNNMALAMVPLGAAAGSAVSLLGATQQLAGALVPSLAATMGTSGRVMATTMWLAAVVGFVQIFAVLRPRLRTRPDTRDRVLPQQEAGRPG
ncbi:MAG: multidrug effflux MFS transporter [Nocardioides sp.]|nr:multidrug effflux MFS transporter [Nocardioides sp.]